LLPRGTLCRSFPPESAIATGGLALLVLLKHHIHHEPVPLAPHWHERRSLLLLINQQHLLVVLTQQHAGVVRGGGDATVEGDVRLGGERGRYVGRERADVSGRLREEDVEGLLAVVLDFHLGPTC